MPMRKQITDKICLALDVDFSEAKRLVGLLKDFIGIFKVGSQLYTSAGREIIKVIRDEAADVFLDSKLHDIPNTVANTTKEIVKLEVSMFNVHALGGFEMMKKAASTAAEESEKLGLKRPMILAVTLLTSINEEILHDELKIKEKLKDYVVGLAKMAQMAGIDGVVASPQEITLIREACGKDFLVVTPGIRPLGTAAHDQKRIMTPKEAIRAGADILVIGRAITSSPDPIDTAKRILNECWFAR